MNTRFRTTTGVMLLLVAGCGPSQIGPDREAFKTVDAMYTAVSLREPVQLGRCEATFRALKSAGKLPEPAYNELNSIAEEAKGGHWESAQLRLHDFMQGQHR